MTKQKKRRKETRYKRSRRSWGFGKVKETVDVNNQNAKEMGVIIALY